MRSHTRSDFFVRTDYFWFFPSLLTTAWCLFKKKKYERDREKERNMEKNRNKTILFKIKWKQSEFVVGIFTTSSLYKIQYSIWFLPPLMQCGCCWIFFFNFIFVFLFTHLHLTERGKKRKRTNLRRIFNVCHQRIAV